jgi:hypothetical protein
MTHTPESLLSAVGVDWQARPDLSEWKYGLPTKLGYTGPALDTPELDAILIVAGLKCLRESNVEVRFSVYEKLGPFWFFTQHPGHALAAAIAEVRNG